MPTYGPRCSLSYCLCNWLTVMFAICVMINFMYVIKKFKFFYHSGTTKVKMGSTESQPPGPEAPQSKVEYRTNIVKKTTFLALIGIGSNPLPSVSQQLYWLSLFPLSLILSYLCVAGRCIAYTVLACRGVDIWANSNNSISYALLPFCCTMRWQSTTFTLTWYAKMYCNVYLWFKGQYRELFLFSHIPHAPIKNSYRHCVQTYSVS